MLNIKTVTHLKRRAEVIFNKRNKVVKSKYEWPMRGQSISEEHIQRCMESNTRCLILDEHNHEVIEKNFSL